MGPAYEAAVDKAPAIARLFADEADRDAWLEEARGVIDGYFAIEQPRWIAPAAREERVTTTTAGGVRLLGFIDRIDAAPDGRLRVVDYKTGKAPGPRYVDRPCTRCVSTRCSWRERGGCRRACSWCICAPGR